MFTLQRCGGDATEEIAPEGRCAAAAARLGWRGLKDPPDAIAAAPSGLGQCQDGHEILSPRSVTPCASAPRRS
jgi:hypothetical protein